MRGAAAPPALRPKTLKNHTKGLNVPSAPFIPLFLTRKTVPAYFTLLFAMRTARSSTT